MLTDLDFINDGKPWPPTDPDEKARLAEHQKNCDLYNDLHEKVFEKYAYYLRDKIDDDKKLPIILGWAEIATTSYLNFLIGQAPEVSAPVDPIPDRPDEEVFIDVSRFGLGLYELSQEGIHAINPVNVYLVVQSGNVRKVQYYVIFSEFYIVEADKKKEYVKFTIHSPGKIQHIVKELKNGKIVNTVVLTEFSAFKDLQVDNDGFQNTGVEELLIVRVDNSFSSERYYGRSDYSPAVHSLIEALDQAFSRRAEVLAKFSRPTPVLPESACDFDHNRQRWVFRPEKAIVVTNPGDVPPQYLTWQAELGAVEKEIENFMDQLLYKLGLSRVLLAGKDAGTAESGTALKIRLIPTLSKVRKYATALQIAISEVLSLKSKLDVALQVNGAEAFEPLDVSVQVRDGIPSDPVETAKWASACFVAQGMSLETFVSLTQDLDPESEALQQEVDRIRGMPIREVIPKPRVW